MNDPMFESKQWRMYASELGAYIECWYEEQYKPKPDDNFYFLSVRAMLQMVFHFRKPETVARHIFYGRNDPRKMHYFGWLSSDYVAGRFQGDKKFEAFNAELQQLCTEQIRMLYP